MTFSVNPQIFRQYDIRGVVDKDLTEPVVEALGRGYGTYMRSLGKRRASLGRDMRLSSERFKDALARGMLSAGLDVVDIGLVPTPALYFSLFTLDVDGGIMITGSHNPPEFNGFKVGVEKTTIYGEEIQNLRRIVEAGDFAKGRGALTQKDVIESYVEAVKGRIGPFARPLRVVADAGNGMAGRIVPRILRELGAEVIELYCELDGTFPNHHPDPTVPEYLQALIARVREENADLGLAYDGDADRLGVVDENGRIIWGDQLMILFSREVLAKKPGASIIFEVKCSQALVEEIERAGGQPIMWKTGHSLIKEKMKELNAPLAGEMSGHLFFADEYFGYDDAIYASCRLVRLLARSEKTIGQMLADVPVYYSTPETRVDCSDEEKFKVVEELSRHFKKLYDTIDVDGVRILFGDGWGLVRASNTQPVLVLRFEARSPERLEEIKKIVLSQLAEFPAVRLPASF
ncbi:MAG: phosphomannomutase/phosphoglucomutase [Anaerolineae bacterium]